MNVHRKEILCGGRSGLFASDLVRQLEIDHGIVETSIGSCIAALMMMMMMVPTELKLNDCPVTQAELVPLR